MWCYKQGQLQDVFSLGPSLKPGSILNLSGGGSSHLRFVFAQNHFLNTLDCIIDSQALMKLFCDIFIYCCVYTHQCPLISIPKCVQVYQRRGWIFRLLHDESEANVQYHASILKKKFRVNCNKSSTWTCATTCFTASVVIHFLSQNTWQILQISRRIVQTHVYYFAEMAHNNRKLTFHY